MKHGLFSGLLAGSLLAVTVATAGDYPYRPANMTDVSIKEGFWLPRFETNRKVTVWADFRKSEETGRIANFINAARRLKGSFKGIPFDDIIYTVYSENLVARCEFHFLPYII